MNKLKGGLSDNKTLSDIAIKHTYDDSRDSLDKGKYNSMLKHLNKQLDMGLNIESEHTKDKSKAKEIAMDHLWEDPNYYTKLKKIEATESTGADSAGAFEPAFGSTPIKRKINVIHNLKEEEELGEVTTASSSGAYDVPFGDGGKNPLKIGGPDSIKNSRAVKDKNFPKWGGPKGVFIKIKEKCKKYPYCNQGDIKAIEMLEIDELTEAVKNVSKKTGIPYSQVEKIVIKEINKIFIK